MDKSTKAILSASLTAKIFGIIAGIAILIVGINLMKADVYSIGKSGVRFGADFYTEIYDVTQDVGGAVNRSIRSMHQCAGTILACIGALTSVGYLNKAVDVILTLNTKKPEEIPQEVHDKLPDL